MTVVGLRGWQAPTTLKTPRDDVVALLFEPALRRAREYKRAVGYFSSAWLAHNAVGLAHLASSGGRARWITSPYFSEEDWKALNSGASTTSALVLRRTVECVDDLARVLASDTRNTLAWMVADGFLDFRIALPTVLDARSDFHTKFGVFCDADGPAVAFVGSMNESERGLKNHETISVFSVGRDSEEGRVAEFDAMFEDLWDGRDGDFDVVSLPEAARSKLVELRSEPRPYAEPAGQQKGPRLRAYQNQALEAWVANGCRGILEMATGSGKTITAIECARHLLEGSNSPKIVLVACPFQHLVDQWGDQLVDLGLPVVRAYENSTKWRTGLADLRLALDTGIETTGVVVTTYKTLTSKWLVGGLRHHLESTVFIADECHYLGASGAAAGMRTEIPYRLGLSATPARHYDDGGTERIMTYFHGVVFEFGLQQALAQGFLVPYTYEPEIVELTWDEAEEYARLSERLSRLVARNQGEMSEQAKKLAILRAGLLNNAQAKVDWLETHLAMRPAASWSYALVYAGDKIFDSVTELIGRRLGIRVHAFTAEQTRSERASILTRFENQDLQILAAMKCLDEGVDVPPTRTAFFLASSGNPREYVQRRGRILRRAPGKESARIVDAIAMPPSEFLAKSVGSPEWKAVQSALRSQLRRIEEFSSLATNRSGAERAVFDLRLRYNLPVTDLEVGVNDAD